MSTPDQMAAMLAESRKKSMLKYVSEGATKEDLDAAGYTPEEIAIIPKPEPLVTSKEFDRDRQAGTNQNTLEAYSPTYRDYLRSGIEQGATALGANEGYAKYLANRTAGSGGEMGAVDMTGLGAPLFIQEGKRQIARGYNTGSKTDMALGALGVGMGAISAIPAAGVVSKGIVKGAEKLGEKFLTRQVEQTIPEVIQAAEAPVAREAAQVIPEAVPTNTTPATIRPDNQFRGQGNMPLSYVNQGQTPADFTGQYAIRTTGQDQIEDIIQSGLVRQKVGGYGRDQKSTLYFGTQGSPETKVGFSPGNLTASSPYAIVAKADEAAKYNNQGGVPLDALQHIWTMRNGEVVDILPEVRLKNLDYKAPEVTPPVDQTYADGGDVGKAIKENPIWQHHMSNVESGKTVKNKDGSVSTVRTLIMGDGQYEYLIPTVWDGKILSNEDAWKRAMSSGINWPKARSGEEGVKSLEYLDQQLHKNMTPTGFAQGGTVEQEQMNKLMQEGGIAGSNVAREPVTGNEVPPGSMPSEVRDDIPTQLSEGEYVVPSDVVRYFGVKYFEDLRSQAKQGLAGMQSDGRIGGASVDSNGVPADSGQQEELTPEEEQMLQRALGSAGPKTGMADGGVVPFDRTKFTLNDTATTETRKYIDPKTGVVQDFQFMYGSPVVTIPANFVPWTQAAEDTATKPKTNLGKGAGGVGNFGINGEGADSKSSVYTPSGSAGTGSSAGIGGFNYDKWAKENYADITSNPYQFGVDALTDTSNKNLGKGLGIAGLLAPGILGPIALAGSLGVKAGSQMQNIAEANAALQVMKAQGLEGTTEYTNLQKTIGIAVNALPKVEQVAVEKHLAATGDNYVKALTSASTATPVKATSTVKPTSTSDKNNVDLGNIGTVSGNGNGGGQDRDTSTGTGTVKNATASFSASAGQPSVKETTSSSTSSYGQGGSKTEDRRAKGGLITRPTKKKK